MIESPRLPLSNPDTISDYDKKAAFLRDKGWRDLWHPDNWIRQEWMDDTKCNVDWMGLTMAQALEVEGYKNA
jgi:hypothetical protein